MYTLENTKELFLVTKSFDTIELHLVMSKREVQAELKSIDRQWITNIERLKLCEIETMDKKYFVPKDWIKINKKCKIYHIWKEIMEGRA
jgi:hypothetical protein